MIHSNVIHILKLIYTYAKNYYYRLFGYLLNQKCYILFKHNNLKLQISINCLSLIMTKIKCLIYLNLFDKNSERYCVLEHIFMLKVAWA